MNPVRRISNPLGKAVMLFDGNCRFCCLWIRRWQQSTGDTVEYIPLQDPKVAAHFPDLEREELEKAVHLISADGLVYSGAEAVFRSLAVNPTKQWPLGLYQGSTTFAKLSERAYGFVANNRTLFSWITRVLWGGHVEVSQNFLTRWLFLRGLGLIYLIAFVSLWIQGDGLIGKQGILPAAELMSQARRSVEANGIGTERFRLLPTLCWFADSDGALRLQCGTGAGLALAVVVGVAPAICLAGMWVLYLSLTTVGQVFLGFQWDNLLLEVGFLAIFLAPAQLLPRPTLERPPSRAVLWLFRLLLFKLMFLSGVVKLTSGDTLWRNLTALSRHYETQPLPNAIAWYVHQSPLWFHKTSCVFMFTIELGAPFLLFTPRRLRMIGAVSIASLQVFILLSGNYTFFNWLALLLCFIACDDFTWTAVVPRKLANLYSTTSQSMTVGREKLPRWKNVPITALCILVVSISLVEIVSPFGSLPFWLQPAVPVYRWLSPLRSINGYGLFAVMTPDRPEIICEGSNDGREWKEYSFRHKPGPLNRPPTFVAPHQPRLDWQMWFAALGDARRNPWFVNFCVRLLQGSPEVLALMDGNPFPNSPPKYIRAQLYQYHFTTAQERAQTGNWWKREFKGEYLPPISLEMLKPNR